MLFDGGHLHIDTTYVTCLWARELNDTMKRYIFVHVMCSININVTPLKQIA